MSKFFGLVILLSTSVAFSSVLIEESSFVSYGSVSAFKMREQRKVGLGLLAGGKAGLLATQIDLNFEESNGAEVIFGGGSGYNSIGFFWKHLLTNGQLAPYVSTGYLRWYNVGGSDRTSPFNSGFVSQFLSRSEKRTGRFGLDFITGSIGFQYFQGQGPARGLTYFGEASLLFNPEVSKGGMAVGLGTSYLF